MSYYTPDICFSDALKYIPIITVTAIPNGENVWTREGQGGNHPISDWGLLPVCPALVQIVRLLQQREGVRFQVKPTPI